MKASARSLGKTCKETTVTGQVFDRCQCKDQDVHVVQHIYPFNKHAADEAMRFYSLTQHTCRLTDFLLRLGALDLLINSVPLLDKSLFNLSQSTFTYPW